MLSKEYLNQINPNQNPYNGKYSHGTYRFLFNNKNKDIKVYWKKTNYIDGEVTDFNQNNIRFYPTQIYFMYESNGDWLGVSWTIIMQNKYKVSDYTCFMSEDEFEDITEFFFSEYLRIGRCLFDQKHINFLLGKDYNYVTKEERFETVDGIKKCRWCGKEII